MSVVFYQPEVARGIHQLIDEEASHCARVLRKNAGDIVEVMDGKGSVYKVTLTRVDHRITEFEIISKESTKPDGFHVHLAIAPTKNADRMEWMLEKCVEIGLHELTFLQCDHSERSRLRFDRLEKKAVSAMKQCRRPFALNLNTEQVPFKHFLDEISRQSHTTVAMGHVSLDHPHLPLKEWNPVPSSLLLIGPEGDFSESELRAAQKWGVQLVSLGPNRLRTETAGLIGTHTLLEKYQ